MGASVRGAVHEAGGMPNQDAVAWSGSARRGQVVVALSDGHGSPKAFRSQRGARMAVDIAVASGLACLDRLTAPDPARIDDLDCGQLAKEIVERWTAAVGDDLVAQPLVDDELLMLAELDGPPARQAVASDPVLAYGATLLLAVLVESGVAFLQLGDGDILAVSSSGVATRALPDDARLLGNETTSLCMPHADQEFRFAVRPLAADGTEVILLATDGLGNAYPDESSLLDVGTDLLKRIRSAGLDAVACELDGYLQEASTHSGDDASLAVIWLGPA